MPERPIISTSVAYEVVGSDDLTQLRILNELVEIEPHPLHYAELLTLLWLTELLPIEARWLLVEQEQVSMGSTTWRRSGRDVVSYIRSTRSAQLATVVPIGFQTWLNPVQDRTEEGEAWKWGVEV